MGIDVKEWVDEDNHGKVKYAKLNAFGNTSHTLIERANYPQERFLPKWDQSPLNDSLEKSVWSHLPPVGLQRIDHLALNQYTGTMNKVAQWYQDTLRFKRFWSKDETVINTENSGLRSVFLVNDESERIKLTINEPIQGTRKSQIQEFLDYHNGPGVQHIAFHTDDIVESIKELKKRGTFL